MLLDLVPGLVLWASTPIWLVTIALPSHYLGFLMFTSGIFVCNFMGEFVYFVDHRFSLTFFRRCASRGGRFLFWSVCCVNQGLYAPQGCDKHFILCLWSLVHISGYYTTLVGVYVLASWCSSDSFCVVVWSLIYFGLRHSCFPELVASFLSSLITFSWDSLCNGTIASEVFSQFGCCGHFFHAVCGLKTLWFYCLRCIPSVKKPSCRFVFVS